MKRRKGKLIVIAGMDGSGKATQTDLLRRRLRKEGYRCEVVAFPRYGKGFFADMVARYLNGEFGSEKSVSPYLASLLYAGDRWEYKPVLERWLSQGKIIISNRYVCANMGHQGGKINDARKRREFMKWVERLEYEVFGIPRPDLNILLDVPVSVARRLVQLKGERKYIRKGKKDIHEASLAHLRRARRTYLEIASRQPNWAIIGCVEGRKLLPPEAIAERVWEVVCGVLAR